MALALPVKRRLCPDTVTLRAEAAVPLRLSAPKSKLVASVPLAVRVPESTVALRLAATVEPVPAKMRTVLAPSSAGTPLTSQRVESLQFPDEPLVQVYVV